MPQVDSDKFVETHRRWSGIVPKLFSAETACAEAIVFGGPSGTTFFIAPMAVLIGPGARLDTWYRRGPGRSDLRDFHRDSAWGSGGRGSRTVLQKNSHRRPCVPKQGEAAMKCHLSAILSPVIGCDEESVSQHWPRTFPSSSVIGKAVGFMPLETLGMESSPDCS